MSYLDETINVRLYSFVAKKDSIIFPLFEFLSSDHTSTALSKYFSILKSNITIELIANLIILDFEWSHIHSILRVFNNSNINEYLHFCYAYCTNQLLSFPFEITSKIKTFIFVNSTNILQNFLSKLKTQGSFAKIEFCLKSFIQIQKCTSLIEINDMLKKIMTIFLSKSNTLEVAESLAFMKNKFHYLQINERKSFSCSLDSRFDLSYESLITNTTKIKIKCNSPFNVHFNKLIEGYEQNINKEQISNDKNTYFAPEQFKTLSEFLWLVPLWTNVIICDTDINQKTTDDTAECWFFKHKVKNQPFRPYDYAMQTLNFLSDLAE